MLECLGGSVYSLLVTTNYVACGTYENKINVSMRRAGGLMNCPCRCGILRH